MSERIITLFGEEIVPEQPKPPAKTRTRKKTGQQDAGEQELLPAEPDHESTAGADVPGEAEPGADIPVAVTKNTADEATAPAAESNITREETPATPQPVAIIAAVAQETPVEPTVAERTAERAETAAPVEVAEPTAGDAADDQEETQSGTAKKEVVQLAKLPDNWEGTKQYYTIGEVAELFKVKTSHIRFWTNEFKLKVRTTRKGDRLYTPEQIKKLKAINNLVKERGFTLKGAKSKLKTSEKIEVESVDLKQSLLQLRSKLQAIRNQLK